MRGSAPRGNPSPRGAARRLTPAACLVVALAMMIGVIEPSHALAATPRRPDLIVIVTDDQRWDTLWAMPTVRRELADRGIVFPNAFVPTPTCCPSRASLLTGKYAHSTGVWRNHPPYGGFESFDDSATIATALRASGYRTALFGKYLNGYEHAAWDTAYVPPGWDRWVAFAHSRYYDYDLNVDGALLAHASAPEDYSTDVLADHAVAFIEETNGPLFAYFAPFAPHLPTIPAPRHEGEFGDLERWRPPNYNERDVSDKPAWLQEMPRWPKEDRARIDELAGAQVRSLLAVDEAIGRLLEALDATGRLSEAMIVFMSDNGYSLGEHRLKGKGVPYEESIRVPFVVRYDPLVRAPREEADMVLNIDVAPTFADLAHATLDAPDGASLVPLLSSARVGWRDDFLLERMGPPGGRVPPYCGVRRASSVYVLYATGEQELYDLKVDPHQLDNVAADPAHRKDLRSLHKRVRELCDPPPPGFAT